MFGCVDRVGARNDSVIGLGGGVVVNSVVVFEVVTLGGCSSVIETIFRLGGIGRV